MENSFRESVFAKDPHLEILAEASDAIGQEVYRSDEIEFLRGTPVYGLFIQLSPGDKAKCRQRYAYFNEQTLAERALKDLETESKQEGSIVSAKKISMPELMNNLQRALQDLEDDKERAAVKERQLLAAAKEIREKRVFRDMRF